MAFDPMEHARRVIAQYREIQGLRDIESPVEPVSREQVIAALETLGIDPQTTRVVIEPTRITVTRSARDENDALVRNPYADVVGVDAEPLVHETYTVPVEASAPMFCGTNDHRGNDWPRA
ncbi:hypothetical protein [Gordonia terrae]|uniref:hypothetical protein n=1 Tax=Gordonia terrae TaxID=2055 RepID=UPI003F6B12A3